MRNIIIYSDGTGQRGGMMFDERRSNIYKLYRATRCGPDSSVDPAEQLAFYDPGLGTLPPGNGLLTVKAWRWFYNLASRATGLGLTGNIIDCYAAIVRLWRPGDRIFLFGFSRGAYTVRCLGAVLGMCGIPTQDEGGKPLQRNKKTSKRIACEAVKKVYQHTASKKESGANEREKELLRQRRELASRFREKYKSIDPADSTKSNGYPYFIGVFDTVASLANPLAIGVFLLLGLLTLAIPSGMLAFFFGKFLGFGWWYLILAASAIVIGLLINRIKAVRSEFGLKRNKHWRPFHFTEWRMKFYDLDLDPRVEYARHAISIDEQRKSFQRVGWGLSTDQQKKTPEWFVQQWFAGNHSDIGGSYHENESRLSDISLQWMLDAAASVGMKYDESVLKLFPDPTGPQHDEAQSSFLFRLARKSPRRIPSDAPLHPSVLERLQATEVFDYDTMRPYRPDNLKTHSQVKEYYPEP
jgi:uncharacterized protein (DUF2235 family)